MIKSITIIPILLIGTSLLISCQSPKQSNVEVTPVPPPIVSNPEITECKSPRPQMCTKEYRPVCATRDTGVRCVTTPCPSTELVTNSNACTACSDEKVFGYIPGACS